jgi:hypothetical protein
MCVISSRGQPPRDNLNQFDLKVFPRIAVLCDITSLLYSQAQFGSSPAKNSEWWRILNVEVQILKATQHIYSNTRDATFDVELGIPQIWRTPSRFFLSLHNFRHTTKPCTVTHAYVEFLWLAS